MLAKFIQEVEKISQERKVEIVIHIAPHGNFIIITLPNEYSMTFDYDLEMKMAKELGLNPSDADFINDLINQTTDNS